MRAEHRALRATLYAGRSALYPARAVRVSGVRDLDFGLVSADLNTPQPRSNSTRNPARSQTRPEPATCRLVNL